MKISSFCLASAVALPLSAACGGTDGNVLFEGTGASGGKGSASTTGSSSGEGPGSGGASSSSASGPTSSSSGAGGSMINCSPPMADCDNDPGNGCEVDLTSDAANCGKCGYSCGVNPCVNAACQIVPPAQWVAVGDNSCLATDGVNIYWTTGRSAAMGGEVLSIPVAGAPNPTVLAPMQDGPRGIATDGASVYFTNSIAGTVNRVAIGGGVIAPIASGQGGPFAVTNDANNVYWTNRSGGSVMQAPKAGGVAPTPVATGLVNPSWIAVDATDVYWTTGGMGNSVQKAPIGGGAVTTVAMNQMGANGIALDALHIYWVNTKGGEVQAMMKGANAPVSLVTGLTNPYSIVVDATDAFWIDSNANGDASKVPLAGGAQTILSPNQKSATCVAIDATSVYWLDAGGSAINKAAK